jgi:hypothetical protein
VWANVPIVGEVVGQRALKPRAEERTFLAQERVMEQLDWLSVLR